MWNAVFVALGAALWATDTLFRHPLVHQISAITIVYFEHIFATLVSFIWVLIAHRKKFFLGWKETLGAAFIGVFGSALATVLFTDSFQFINPSVAILLQKMQPIFVIFLSSLFLNERISGTFLVWAGIALVSAFTVSFPSGIHLGDLHSAISIGSIFAISAAALWALSTVVGKVILKNTPSPVLTFWRFAFGLIALYFFARYNDQSRIEIPFVTDEREVIRSLVIMALLPGFLGVSLYYRGLSRVPASVATLLELSFPLAALWMNSYFLGFHLSSIQLFAAGALLVSFVGVSVRR
jgi:drug/metabolite transporter (DMT)-like permease